jgi:rare lipoprotein A
MKVQGEWVRTLFKLFVSTGLFFISLQVWSPSPSLAAEKKGPGPNQKSEIGWATYYGHSFHGKKTAFGKTYNRDHLVAAHPTYPYGSLVRVTRLANRRQVIVRIIDRGPSKHRQRRGVVVDLSRAAAEKLGMIKKGKVWVQLEILERDNKKQIHREREDDDNETES